ASQQFDLKDFMTSLAGATTTQQCDDNANTLTIFARSQGVAANGLRFYGAAWGGLKLVTDFRAGLAVGGTHAFVFPQILQFPDTTKVYDPATRQAVGGDPAAGIAFDPTYLAVFTDGTTNQVTARYSTVTVTTLTINP